MKPEHFIYKSDGLYYMQNVPDKCYYYYRDERTQTEEFDHKSYNEALERAKAEAVLVTDPYVYQIAMHRYFPHFIDYSKTPQDNFAMCASIGQVYLLNMEEKIEVIDEPEFPGFDHTSYPMFRKVARIVVPKKEEESEHQWNIWREAIEIPEKMRGMEDYEVIQELEKHFEIKRKPL